MPILVNLLFLSILSLLFYIVVDFVYSTIVDDSDKHLHLPSVIGIFFFLTWMVLSS